MEPAVENKPLTQWSETERISAVKRIFNTITPQYDLLNRIMSGRRDVAWRRFAVSRIPADAGRVIDVATGTGDVAMEIANQRPDARVWGVDFVERMMRLAQIKTSEAGLTERIRYAAGDAMALPFPDNTFDCATVAFGIRNMPDRARALREMSRVVRPGGKIICLEMTFPRNLGFRRFFTWYLNTIIPLLGGLISRDRKAYRYLPDSIQDFLHPDDLLDLFRGAGLNAVSATPLTFGLTYVHEGLVA